MHLLSRAAHNSVAVAVPQGVGLAVVVAFGFSHGNGATSAIGAATSVFGAAVLLSVGCAITTIRAVSKKIASSTAGSKEHPAFLPAILESEFGIAWIFGMLGLAIAWALVGIAVVVSPGSSVTVASYVLGASVWILVAPHSSVTVGAFQSLDRDRFNAILALVTGATQVAAASVILLLGLSLERSTLLVALSGSALAVAALAYRLRELGRIARGRVTILRFGRIVDVWKELSLRAAAGADGVVYMTVFLLATTLATRSSVASGAAIALAVSVMRLLIIPIKQLGLVGGRLLAQGAFETPFAGLRTIRITAAFACAAAALGALAWGALPSGIAFGLAVLLAAQLLIEPIAGVQYAAIKVAIGPGAGVRLLLICYWVLAPLLLLLGSALGFGEPWMIWLVLLAVRLIFATGVVRITHRQLRSMGSSSGS